MSAFASTTLRRAAGSRWLVPVLAAILLGQLAVAMLTAAREQSPTVDEPVYIGTAAVYLTRHSIQLNPEHPPLAKLLVAAALAPADVRLDPDYDEGQWRIGNRVLYGETNDADRILFLARLPTILLTLLFGLVVYAFGRDLGTRWGGLLALTLYAFSPDVIAHGSLATNDVPLAGFLLTTLWLLWRARARWWPWLPLAGLAFGCAMATKMTALPVLPVVLLLAGWSGWQARRSGSGGSSSPGPTGRRSRFLAGLAAAGLVGLLGTIVVWITYLIVDPRLRFTHPAEIPHPDGLTGLLVRLLPLPEAYRSGLAVQLSFEQQDFPTYLFGELHPGTPWYYLPAAVLVKTPLGMLALWLAGASCLLAVRRFRSAAAYLLLPAVVLLGVAMAGSRSFGVRYVIWLPLLLGVAAAGLLAYRRRWVPVLVWAVAAFVAVSSVRAFPYYLPYSNEAFGGPAETHRYLNDSNVDWGQDLRRLGEYLARHPTDEQVWLLYKGRGSPAYYGIDAADPTKVPPEQVRGLLAVSEMRISLSPDGHAALVAGREPITVIGHTIRIYRIP
ncbi:phospholipid carrier-dependent glycosyltransferase [Micromonospora sp. CPCC 206060]|uniref:ArnT family glycosyltransferase n=1 Tax=Micromonospora sp. CPCC 206060 TaxID=3122406 RepID=UPI002FF1B99F